mmetsp:Transcript_71405/g.119535  ORF Transcript_71405/g.119535 Transcript_71405/m.119535 type:complete len:302 (-) Transcript_71405:129-1034(-)
MLAELLPLAPHNPAGSAHGLPELVPAGGDGHHVLAPEIPRRKVLLKRGDEPAGRRVHVDPDLPALVPVELLNALIDLPNAVVLPAVVVAQNAHHGDGPLVAVRRQLLPTDIHRLVRGLHQNGLHVHVLEELLPAGLVHGGHHQVRIHPPHLAVRQPMLLLVPVAPPKLQGEPRKQCGLRRAHAPGPGHLPVRGLRHTPEVPQHVHHLVVQLERRRIHGLVRQVDLHPHDGHALLLGLEHHVDVRGCVEALVVVQQVVVLDHALTVPGGHARLRDGFAVRDSAGERGPVEGGVVGGGPQRRL